MVQITIGKVECNMLITAIQIRRIENSGTKMHGIVTVTLDEMIAIHDIKVLKNGDSLFLAMPSRATKSNTFKDVVHPINSDVRQVLERLIFAAYGMANSMKCGHLELILKEEKRNTNFYDLSIKDYDTGRITAPAVQQTSNNSNMRKIVPTQQKKQPEKRTDDDLLKWLEG